MSGPRGLAVTDPFQDVDAVGSEFVEIVAGALEGRATEEGIARVIDGYLDDLDWPDGGLHVEVGAGNGLIARRMAARAGNGRVVGGGSVATPGRSTATRRSSR